jgi:hypothetical protein
VSDIDTRAVDSLKVLDPKRPIREADVSLHRGERQLRAKLGHEPKSAKLGHEQQPVPGLLI